MEIQPTSQSDPTPARRLDPSADLDLLHRAKAVDVDQALDFGPWWYAPLLATMIGGLTLFGQDVDSPGSIAALVIAVAAGGVVALHDHRRRVVRLRASWRSVALLALLVVGCWILVGAWGTAVSTLGIDRFVPGYAALAWVLTSIALLVTRAGFLAIRRRRRPLA